MGFFTYRQTKKTKQEVRKLRAQEREHAAAQSIEQRMLAQQARDTELFQQLPPEGKEELRAAQAAFRQKWQTFGAWKRTGKAGNQALAELAAAKTSIFRKYDLIP